MLFYVLVYDSMSPRLCVSQNCLVRMTAYAPVVVVKPYPVVVVKTINGFFGGSKFTFATLKNTFP